MQTVLDIGCGFGSFGAHLLSLKLMTVCIAAYEVFGSQVQLALERGLPAMLGDFISKQLPYPPLSFDMVHCAQCGITWDNKGTSNAFCFRHFFPFHEFNLKVKVDLTSHASELICNGSFFCIGLTIKTLCAFTYSFTLPWKHKNLSF